MGIHRRNRTDARSDEGNHSLAVIVVLRRRRMAADLCPLSSAKPKLADFFTTAIPASWKLERQPYSLPQRRSLLM